jgi:hemolysin activation/secretion protein
VSAKVKVQRVEVLGSTAFSPPELQAAVASFIGKEATFEDLLAIRAAITTLYTQNGYTTSGAFLPPQDVTNGVVQVQVVEGAIEKIEIQGLRRLRTSYVRSRLNLAAQPPVNIHRLEEALQLLQVNPLISYVKAELSTGTAPGLSVLKLTLTEAQPLTASFLVQNRDSPEVGSIRGTASIAHNDFLGFGDRLSFDYGVSKGINAYNIIYELPVNARDGTLRLSYTNIDSRIIEAPFNSAGIKAEGSNLSLGFIQPLVKTPTSELILGLSLDLRRSQTYLLENVPFSFGPLPESEKGRTRLNVLRFSQEWLNRSTTQVLSARSQFSFGLDAFDATVSNSGADGRFTSWLGQFQWVQLLGKETILIARTAAQLSSDSLLALEQFSVGGIETVRGYRQGQLFTDNGIAGSLEVLFPIVHKSSGIGEMQLVPFFDIGTAWNNKGKAFSPNTLASLGLGWRWQIDPYFSARIDWGIPLISVKHRGDSLQDNGIFFSIRYQPF